ncbi:MAG TPA: thiamine-phosphate kinase [Candidatus Methylacidiphilales bacterium]|jgi:thiamine-monophosphate kinase|nr:thiamine-phosphate kinase [Candidatus Methylacidiphilales bacterium]
MSTSASLARLGEDGLLHLLTGRWQTDARKIFVGTGDDCAVLRGEGKSNYLLFKTDAVVESVHFRPREKPELIGRKALARALSDLAAMGATPLAAVITLGVAKRESVRRLKGIYAGLEKIAKKYGVNLVGGETTRAKELFLNVALLGECRGYAPVLRSGAKPGDLIAVTGRLGGTRVAKHLQFEPRLAEGQWLARKKFATAMMDLSDGLGADLPRLARASGVSFRLEAGTIPRSPKTSLRAAISDGEDYELLFTVRSALAEKLKKEWPFATPVHFIGAMGRRGAKSGFPRGTYGFDHFKQH